MEDGVMPKKISPQLKERAVRLVTEHRAEYSSTTAAAAAVARPLGVGKESVRRRVVQADIDGGVRAGLSSEEHAEIKRLKARVRRLEEDNEILKAATTFFVGELDPRSR
jgi:transposase